MKPQIYSLAKYIESLECSDNQLTALNMQGLAALHTLSYRHNPLTDLNLTPAYLPSSGSSNNTPNAQQKITRDQEQMQDDNQMEQEEKEPGDEPDAKLRKTS